MRFLKTREGMVNVDYIVRVCTKDADDHEVHVCTKDGVTLCFAAPKNMTQTDAAKALRRALLDDNGHDIITAENLVRKCDA